MDQYRKKPLVVRAFRVDGLVYSARADWPRWLKDHFYGGDVLLEMDADGLHLKIETDTGTARANRGEWIIEDPSGAIYPCSDAAFRRGFERVGTGEYIGEQKCVNTDQM